MDALKSLTSGLNPLDLLGGAGLNGLEGTDPVTALLALLSNQGAASQGQDQGQVCSCGGSCGEGGACSCGCSCCQKNQDLGF